jgi:hypothetical protein
MQSGSGPVLSFRQSLVIYLPFNRNVAINRLMRMIGTSIVLSIIFVNQSGPQTLAMNLKSKIKRIFSNELNICSMRICSHNLHVPVCLTTRFGNYASAVNKQFVGSDFK